MKTFTVKHLKLTVDRIVSQRRRLFISFHIKYVEKGVDPPFRGAAIPKGPPFSAISSSDNLQLGIRLGLGVSK